MLKIAASTAIALLVATGASRGWAEKAKKNSDEIPASMNKQFEWENRVVGPKEGLDKDRLARIQEQGKREDEARKKEPPKKPQRAAGVAEAGSATLPTMDIEKPAAAPAKKAPKKVASAPAQRDNLDNLLSEQGAKPYSDRTAKNGNGGLDNLFAADAPAQSSGRKTSKKSRR
jgi:hypothetical protein